VREREREIWDRKAAMPAAAPGSMAAMSVKSNCRQSPPRDLTRSRARRVLAAPGMEQGTPSTMIPQHHRRPPIWNCTNNNPRTEQRLQPGTESINACQFGLY
jgi:hypothetical protein